MHLHYSVFICLAFFAPTATAQLAWGEIGVPNDEATTTTTTTDKTTKSALLGWLIAQASSTLASTDEETPITSPETTTTTKATITTASERITTTTATTTMKTTTTTETPTTTTTRETLTTTTETPTATTTKQSSTKSATRTVPPTSMSRQSTTGQAPAVPQPTDDDKREKQEGDILIGRSTKHQLAAGEGFSLKVREVVRLGGSEFRLYQQEAQGIPVLNSLIVTKSAGRGESGEVMERQIGAKEPIEFSPKMTVRLLASNEKSTASLKALCVMAVVNKTATKLTRFTQEKKYFYKDEAGEEYLVKHIEFEELFGQNRGACLVDALTGKVLRSWDPRPELVFPKGGSGGNLKTREYKFGPGEKYSSLPTQRVGSKCLYQTDRVQVFHGRSMTASRVFSPSQVFSIDCEGEAEDAVNGAFSPLNDVFFAADKYARMMQWNSISKWMPGNETARLIAHVGSRMNNAYFSPAYNHMAFGDGGTNFYPLTSHDIVFHEMAHAFTSAYSDLKYSGESSCINEAFSDITGVAGVAFISSEAVADWSIGKQMYKADAALRYLDNPPRDGASINHIDSYNGQNAHYCSGIFNFVFYNLVAVQRMPVQRAWKLFAATNMIQWTTLTTLRQGACDVITTAVAIDYDEDDVMKTVRAFEAAGLGESCGDFARVLQNGVAQTNLGASTGKSRYYKIIVPSSAGQSLKLTIESYGGVGDLDMYVQLNRQATSSDYTWRSWTWSNSEQIEITPTLAGTYHITIKAYFQFSGATLRAKYEPAAKIPSGPLSNCAKAVVSSLPRLGAVYYNIGIPAGSSQVKFITLGEPVGDADLYVGLNALPSRTQYLRRSWRRYNIEEITISTPESGTYYVMVYAYRAFTNVDVVACYREPSTQGIRNLVASTTAPPTVAPVIPVSVSSGDKIEAVVFLLILGKSYL